MEFRFFNPTTGKPDPDLSVVCTGVDAMYQRLAYSLFMTIANIQDQHTGTGSTWDLFQKAGLENRKRYITSWVNTAVNKVRMSDTSLKRDLSEALGEYKISGIEVRGTDVLITIEAQTKAGIVTTAILSATGG